MKIKILYQAMDGKIFDTESECAAYEDYINLYSDLSFEKRDGITKFFIDNPNYRKDIF